MTMKTYDIELRGPKVTRGRKSPEAIGSALVWIEPAVFSCVSMAFRFSSAKRGRPPQWLAAASAINFVGQSNGGESTRLHFEAPLFGEAAADLYAQGDMFGDNRPREDETAFDLMAWSVLDICGQREDSSRFDLPLLRRFERLRGVNSAGVESLGLEGENLPGDAPVLMDRKVPEFAGKLRQDTPRPRRARIAGKLDMIRASDGAFSLELKSGELVHGILAEEQREELRRTWGDFVKVEGMAIYRPSGSLLRIEAEAIARASERDEFFSAIPMPIRERLDLRTLRQPQTPRSGMAKFFGCWPGDETEEELLAALEEIS